MGVPRALGYAAALATVSLAPAAAGADDAGLTGNVLQNSICTNKLACISYIRGITEGYLLGSVGKPYFCLPVGYDYTQLVDVVLLNLRNHPERRASPASYLIVIALHEAFPCGK